MLLFSEGNIRNGSEKLLSYYNDFSRIPLVLISIYDTILVKSAFFLFIRDIISLRRT
jgi:hypothetical protein